VADGLGGDLVDRDAAMDILPGRLASSHAGEVRRACASMVAGAVGAGRGVLMVEARDDLKLFAEWLEDLRRATQPSGHQVFCTTPLGIMKKPIRKGARAASTAAARTTRGKSEPKAGSARHAPPRPRKNRRRLRDSCRWACRRLREMEVPPMIFSGLDTVTSAKS
jgi:hypothetical protein